MSEKRARVEIYQDRKKEWRWRVIAANGKKLSASTESYKRKFDCMRCLQLTKQALEQEML